MYWGYVSMEAGLSLGSNLGDRLAALKGAVAALERRERARVIARSPLYETEPVEVPAEWQGLRFLNAVVILDWPETPDALLAIAHALEAEAGRVRTTLRNEPRPLDLDIIYVDQLVIRTDRLIVPHPRWAERRFVVAPLADVRPELILPGQTDTVRTILERLPPGGVCRLADSW